MDSYSNVTELRHAEISADIEARDEPIVIDSSQHKTRSDHRQGSQPSNVDSNLSASSASEATDESSASDEEKDADDTPNSASAAEKFGDSSDSHGIIKRPATTRGISHRETAENNLHRESDALLQMVPYRPKPPYGITPDRLIGEAPMPNGDPKPTAEGTTASVRLLLDKWTVSGSAPISNILKEESIEEEKKA